ncbi:MAG TPA: SIMPL domain-containing protein [Rhizomicrobium sp.]|nr:SIMPL domain-containing protein [Rhizomicrobium sp.]
MTKLMFALPVSLLLFAAQPVLAADTAPRTLTVSGTGEVKSAPDAAQMSTGVVTQAPTAAAALAANARAMNAVFDTLKRAGIPDKNIQTSNVSVSPQYAGKPGQVQHVAGYQVSNTVSVLVIGMDKIGPTLDALIAAGSNQIDGPNFTIADPKPLLAKAREQAVKDAMAKAQAYASAAGVALGPILSISEGGAAMPPRPMGGMMMSMAKAETPIAAGEESVSADVSITWEIH